MICDRVRKAETLKLETHQMPSNDAKGNKISKCSETEVDIAVLI